MGESKPLVASHGPRTPKTEAPTTCSSSVNLFAFKGSGAHDFRDKVSCQSENESLPQHATSSKHRRINCGTSVEGIPPQSAPASGIALCAAERNFQNMHELPSLVGDAPDLPPTSLGKPGSFQALPLPTVFSKSIHHTVILLPLLSKIIMSMHRIITMTIHLMLLLVLMLNP